MIIRTCLTWENKICFVEAWAKWNDPDLKHQGENEIKALLQCAIFLRCKLGYCYTVQHDSATCLTMLRRCTIAVATMGASHCAARLGNWFKNLRTGESLGLGEKETLWDKLPKGCTCITLCSAHAMLKYVDTIFAESY